MSRFVTRAMLAALVLPLVLASPASADVFVSEVEWQTVGPNVEFRVRFQNDDSANPSLGVDMELLSQPFGAFVPSEGLIGTAPIPPIPPGASFDVFFEVEASSLPPSAQTIIPDGSNPAPGVTEVAQTACPPSTFWNGNVDVFWNGPGGTGMTNYHFGQLQLCPGAGPSYIHVVMDCQVPPGISWSFSGLCPGWTATLVVDAGGVPGGTAPNPIPPGFFDGWICLTADASVIVGDMCHPDLNLTCGSAPAVISLWGEACDWTPGTPVESTTWGAIKVLYGGSE